MTAVLVIKTGALGDVLRTTSILPGLKSRFGDLRVTWLTSDAAQPLVARHRLVDHVLTCHPKDPASVEEAGDTLAQTRWDWLLSLDDEQPLCALAAGLDAAQLSGATLDPNGERTYTDDVEPWFGMGLLSKDGKAAADARKVANRRTHPEIFASMLGIEAGRPELPLPDSALASEQAFAKRHELFHDDLVIGLNTGAGGRWTSKGLPTERVVEYARALAIDALGRQVSFLVLGGPTERPRNDEIIRGIDALGGAARALDPGTDNDLPTFTAIVGLCDLLLTSDSLALHLGVAMDVPIVSFFAPTSAAEIELYGLGEKVASTAADYCSYRPDADNETITVERLVTASQRVLAANQHRRRRVPRPTR
ncbi:MAG: glycosyltransferase family 9 protein [Planctomycetota bacterium]